MYIYCYADIGSIEYMKIHARSGDHAYVIKIERYHHPKLKLSIMRSMTLKSILYLIVAFSLCTCCSRSPQDENSLTLGTFGAFYSKIDSGEEFEQFSRTGEFADIIVDLGTGDSKFVFWRGSSYLPYLETKQGKWYVEEVIPRKGNGDGIRPDRINAYSHVKIIDSTPDKVVVHWRYLPDFSGLNPHDGVDATKFVDEYFTITPNGKVIRSIKQGTEKTDSWNDPKNRIIQSFSLKTSGIRDTKQIEPGLTGPVSAVQGAPVINGSVTAPVAWWKFDEAAGDMTTESVSGQSSEIHGHKSLWKKGVSGTALQFDGYNSYLSLSKSEGSEINTGITLEAWIAIGAYPWNWTPVVQQGDNEGFFLGVDAYGHPGVSFMIGEKWEELVSEAFLERNTWYHITGTYDLESGTIRIYVDGKEAGIHNVERLAVVLSETEIKIGKGMDRRPTDPVRANTFVDSYGFDGLIDEVKIYNTGLSPTEIKEAYSIFGLSISDKERPDMEVRSLPVFAPGEKFGASYSHLEFYETWDNLWRFSEHPDVVVSFDQLPTQFVFWRGAGYIPMMVNENGQWYSNEFNETWGTSGGQGCQEPMSDKEAFTNHARIIENTDARVVVHWRYPLQDVLHVFANVDDETGWGDWSEWYYYIYPDGVAVKKMHLWTHGNRNHQWQESMGIFGPNQHPEQIIETDVALTMVALDGQEVDYSWVGGPPANVDLPKEKVIQHINYKAEYDPVTIGEFHGSNVYGGELTSYSVFPSWNHWPVAQMPSDGRYASFPDRTAHSSLTHLEIPTYKENSGKLPFQQKIMMEGMLNEEPSELIPLAASWLAPPLLSSVTGCESVGYDRSQRAFVLTAVEKKISLSVDATEDHPIVNPCFVIKNWDQNSRATLIVNGEVVPSGTDARQGIIRDTNGSWTLVVWFRREAVEAVQFEFQGN